MRVVGAVKQNNGCCFYRTVLPMEHMPWQDTDVVKIAYNDNVQFVQGEQQSIHIKDIEDFKPDILLFNRTVTGTESIDWYKKQISNGTKLVVDADDYWILGASHPMYHHWIKYGMDKIIPEILSLAEVVFTTNDRLCEKIRPINKNCLVIPNAVPFGQDHYIQAPIVRNIDKMNFLYAGGSTHYRDIALLKGKFERIGTDSFIKDKAIFTLAGYDPAKQNTHCDWDKMASIFKRTGSYQILNTKPIEQHMDFYDSADVVLVPMLNNDFNKYRSVLKVIEAATRELPCIVSAEWPYLELKGLPGIMWVENNKEWLDHIRYCIKNPNFVKDSGKKLAEVIKEKYNLSTWSQVRYQVFQHLLSK